jgi:hypothetical protein
LSSGGLLQDRQMSTQKRSRSFIIGFNLVAIPQTEIKLHLEQCFTFTFIHHG